MNGHARDQDGRDDLASSLIVLCAVGGFGMALLGGTVLLNTRHPDTNRPAPPLDAARKAEVALAAVRATSTSTPPQDLQGTASRSSAEKSPAQTEGQRQRTPPPPTPAVAPTPAMLPPALPLPTLARDDVIMTFLLNEMAAHTVDGRALAGRMAVAEDQLRQHRDSRAWYEWFARGAALIGAIQGVATVLLALLDRRRRKIRLRRTTGEA